MEDLDKEVIEILKIFPENRAQWSQVRNAILMQKPEVDSLDQNNSFNVKLSRSLKRLETNGFVIKEERGHKDVIYHLAKEYCQEQDVFPLFFGLFNPVKEMPTFNEFKKALSKVVTSESDYAEFYEDFKKKWKSFQNNRNLKRKK